MLRLVTCENGVGVTNACGTGSASSAYVAWKTGLIKKSEIDIEVRGGKLGAKMMIKEGEQEVSEVKLAGPAQYVYTGTIE